MKNKKPELRLLEYYGDWETKMLNEVFDILDGDRGKNYPGELDFYKEGHTLFLDTGNVKKNGFLFSNNKFISKKKDEQLKNGKLKLNDFVLTSRGTLGNVAFYDEVIRNKYSSVRINSAMLILRPKLNNAASNNYLEAILRGNIIENFINKNKVGSAQPHITKGEFSKVNINIPASIDEQNRIGVFFKNLDKILSLHQQELEVLKQTKKGFLQKMFPKDGESVPEIRFPVFNDEWKLKKLKEIAEINPKSTLPNEFEYVDLGSVVGTRLLSSLKETKQTAPSRAQRVAKTGDVFYQTVRPYQKNNFLFDLTSDNFVFSTGYAQMRPNIDSYFLLNSLQINSFVVSVMNSCTGTSYPAINSSDLSQLEIMVPVTGEEQVKIGEFFRQLDEVIELKEQEIEALKQTKQGFLQKMFI